MTMPDTPLVSIIMNCYNGEKYLREAIDSVLSQTYQNWELIFWDNQSTDHSKVIFHEYHDERMKYFYAPVHTLLYEARNYALEKASAEFYAFLDVDDWWSPKKLEKQMPLFGDHEVGLVYGNYWLENEIMKTSQVLYKKQLPNGKILDALLKHYTVGLLTIVIRKTAFISLRSGFCGCYNIIGDFDAVIQISANWKLSAIQEPLAHSRLHKDNLAFGKLSSSYIKELKQWELLMRVDPVIGTNKNFYKINDNLSYLLCLKALNDKHLNEAFSNFVSIKDKVLKFKAISYMLLPNIIINLIKSRPR